jgi:hypothetical protein
LQVFKELEKSLETGPINCGLLMVEERAQRVLREKKPSRFRNNATKRRVRRD